MAEPEVIRNAAASRWELHLDGERIGLVDAVESDGRVVLPHTEVDPAHEGHGYAAILVQHVLDDARSRDLRVVPACPYVQHFITRHPEYADLVG